MKEVIKNIIEDIKVDLTDEFNQNFIDKGFFGEKWKNSKIPNRKGSLMNRTGKLSNISKPKSVGNEITWSSHLPYARLHNEGGEVIVTEKMQRFFWAMFFKSNGAISKNAKGDTRINDRNKRFTKESEVWKGLALQKVGTKMKIEKRQFIGDHPRVKQRIDLIVSKNMEELEKQIFEKLKR